MRRNLPAFAIYGEEVQDKEDSGITDDVREKIIRFAQCALAVGQMRNRAYVSIGNVAMGIGGSCLNPNMLQSLPENVHRTLLDRTDPTWPCTWFAPRLGQNQEGNGDDC